MSKYGIIYADPPWHFNNKVDNAFDKKKGVTRTLNINNYYSTMKNEDIAALSVSKHLAEDAACFMWATDTHLPYAIEIMKTWGFKYVTIAFVWKKITAGGKTRSNLGPWVNKNCEICLLGTRGKMLQYKKDNKIQQLVEAERTSHSTKPEEVAHRIEKMFPDLKKIELFARRHRPGWDVWGNDPNISNSIQLEEAETEHSAPAKATPRIRPLYNE
jgi:site-specific DNA-methyltransferase (adenine-specific)